MAEDLWSLIAESLRARPQQSAWICRLMGGRRQVYSYEQIYAHALDLASRLRERGIASGDIVSILAPNGPEWGIAALAIWKLGAVLAPVHVSYSDDELAAMLEAVQPKLILTHGIERRIANSMEIAMTCDGTRAVHEEDAPVTIAGDQLAVLSYTSGSTGTPKMVRLSHNNILSNVLAAAQCARIHPRDRFLSLLPLSHMFEITGGLLLPLSTGATIVLPRVLAASEILQTLVEEKITAVIAVPKLFRNIMLGLERRFAKGGFWMRLYRQLLRLSPTPIRRLLNWPIRRRLGGHITAWVSGGSRLDPLIAKYFRDLGLPIRQGYGLTETSPVISIQDNFARELDSVGAPLEGVKVKIHDPDAQGSGELWVSGPNVMLGYADAEQTNEVMHDGWFNTGDLATLNERGEITLTGRSKRLIVTEAGKNVYPEELETLLERMPDVAEAGVLEVDMRPVVVMVVEGERQVEHARQILSEFNARVSSHNQITRFALVDELPRTPVGKVALQKLPELFAEKEITEASA